MKRLTRILCVLSTITFGAMNTMAIEEAAYTTVQKDSRFELRDYAPHILAETLVNDEFEEAGNQAFGRLFRYISGDNQLSTNVAMTAPVSQEPKGINIPMTTPVGQQRIQESWSVSFMMPASYTIETLPVPNDARVQLRQVPARRMAAVRYSGFWSEKKYRKYKTELESWIRENGLTIAGEPVWARYNPPFTPWFLRRNEILIPVTGGTN